jgi:hypothetical protein
MKEYQIDEEPILQIDKRAFVEAAYEGIGSRDADVVLDY